MDANKKNRAGLYIKLIIAVLAVVLAILFFALYREYRILHWSEIMQSHQSFLNALRSRGPLTPQEADVIQPWITFDYINKIFNLPPDYLRTSLNISDPHYPRITLSRYAAANHTSTNAILDSVKNAVNNYPTSTAPSAIR
jgi:hypothetical protein